MAGTGGERISLLAAGNTGGAGGGSSGGHEKVAERPLRFYLSAIPPSVCGLALGVCSLGVTWQSAAAILVASGWLRVTADIISLVAFNLGCTTLLLYMSKAVIYPTSFLHDVSSSLGNSVLPTFDMTLMVIAMWMYKHGLHSAAVAIWSVAVAVHVVLLLLFARHVVPAVKEQRWDDVTPAWIIPPVGIALASGTASEMGLQLGGYVGIFFWIAIFFFCFFFPAALYKTVSLGVPTPERQEPLVAIFAAPAALLLTVWIALGGHQGHTLTHFLFLLEMLAVVFVAAKIPRLSVLPFTPEHSAFTFPADIAAKSCIIYSHMYLVTRGVMVVCSWLFLFFATFVVTVTAARFCRAGLQALSDPDSLSDPEAA
uniref:C4-dicarboxylate transporter/malic acid transport protein n=1 Tax=Hemiselmis andersenii TaxID=464988 RepID=A0A7S0TX86_HEMAN